MKTEFKAYLDDINEPTAIKDRVNDLLEQYKNLFFEDIQDIFIEEYIDKNGEKTYEALHCFSKNFDFEITNFLFNDKIFIVPTKNNFDVFKIVEKEDYDFSVATDKSRLMISVSASGGNLSGRYLASKKNCEYLTKIIKTYIFPNFYK
jgi:hypothetical protein